MTNNPHLGTSIPQKAMDYVLSSRRAHHEKITLEPFYRKLYTTICRIQKLNLEPLPQLIVTYSPEREAKLFELDGAKYLLYDQYLGQTFNHLNRIYQNSDTPGNILTYCCKYVAEQLLIRGQYASALLFANAYDDYRKKYTPSASGETRRQKITLAQEIFIIAHELAHQMFACNPEFAKHCNESATEVLQTVLRIRGEHHTQIAGDLNAQYGTPIGQFHEAKTISSRHATWIVSNKLKLLDEIASDSYAAFTTYIVCRTIYPASQQEIGEAVALCQRHLRLLRWMDRIVDGVISQEAQPDELGDDVMTLGLRISAARIEFQDARWNTDQDKNEQPTEFPDLHERLVAMSLRYENVLDDPIMFGSDRLVVQALQADGGNDIVDRLRLLSLGRSWVKDAIEAIENLTGWT